MTKEQLDQYFKVRREADTLFAPIIQKAWDIGWRLLGNDRGFKLAQGPLVGSGHISFQYKNEFTKKTFVKVTETSILYDEKVFEEEKNLVHEIIKSLR